MKELKLILFERTSKALDEYTDLDAKLEEQIGIGGWGLKQKRDAAYERFCAIWDIVEEAGLVQEYKKWKEALPQ